MNIHRRETYVRVDECLRHWAWVRSSKSALGATQRSSRRLQRPRRRLHQRRQLRDARLLRFDVVAHGRVVGALKVPLTKAPLGRVPGDGELGLVDARFSAVSNPPKTTSHSAAPRKVLGSARVRLVVRMRSKSRVRSALKPRGALVGSFDGPAAAPKPFGFTKG